jgi:hypothetical protein
MDGACILQADHDIGRAYAYMQGAIECSLAYDLYLFAGTEAQRIQALYQGLFCLYGGDDR